MELERTHHINALTHMRKSVEKLGSSTQGFMDATLMRFLIARSMDPEKAAKMFVEWHKWRCIFVPNGFIPDSQVEDELELKKLYLQGLTKEGNPVVVYKLKLHFQSKDHLQFKRYVVHVLDKTIASSFRGNEKVVAVLDMQNVTYRNVDTRGFIAGFQFLQMVIVSNEDERRNVVKEIGEDVLPEEYGGRAKLVLFQDVSVPMLDSF